MITSAELKSRLQAGVMELEEDIARLKAAIIALDGADNPRPAARRGSSRAPRVAAQAKPEVVPAGKLSALLGKTEGLSTAELARQTNGAPDQVLQMLKELEHAGKAHRSGQRRSTRWHAGGQSQASTSAAGTPRPKPVVAS